MVRCLHNTPPSPVHVHLLTSPSTSMLPVGSTLAFLTFLTTTLPPPNSQTIAAWTRTTTLVVSSAATVSGGGVNGYNIVPLRQLDSPQSPSTTAHTTGPLITGSGGTGNAGNNGGGGSNMPPSSGDLSPGTIGGIAVGVGVFVLLVVAAWWLWHRGRNKSKAEQRRTPPANYPGTLVSRWLDNVSGTQGQAQWR